MIMEEELEVLEELELLAEYRDELAKEDKIKLAELESVGIRL